MELVNLKCPNCGAAIDIKEDQDFAYCSYCGGKVIRKTPSVQKVKIENPIKIDGKVEIVDNELESKLAKVHLLANRYFNDELFRKTRGYDIVIQAFNEALEKGAQDSRVYLELLDFDSKALMEEIREKRRMILDKNSILSDFDTRLQMAIYCEKNEEEKKKIEEKYTVKKEEFIRDLEHVEKIDKQRLKNTYIKVAIISIGLIVIPAIIVFLTVPT